MAESLSRNTLVYSTMNLDEIIRLNGIHCYNKYFRFIPGDMYPSLENEKEMPEWVRNEKEQFAAYRDKDGNGFMDVKEVNSIFLL